MISKMLTLYGVGSLIVAMVYQYLNGSKLSSAPFLKISEFDIDCSLLDESYHTNDIRNSDKFGQLFTDLANMSGPCLYYFTILSGNPSFEIVENIRNYSMIADSKAIPAIKNSIPESSVLYVGKVKRILWGRIIQHLGFYKVNRTQGLQLFYWTKDLKLSVKLTVLEFEPEMINLMEVLENDLAKRLKPILGKHK